MKECSYCAPLQELIPITNPNLLEQCEKRAEDYIQKKVLRLVQDNTRGPDYTEKIYRCRHCGRKYKLSAETYHGRGGEWVETE
jgi:hypothetical protein